MIDLRLALRQLVKNPAFTAVAVLTLALGVGAATIVFSFVNGILLRPLPFPDPDGLVVVFESYAPSGSHRAMVAPPTFAEWREQATLFEGLGARSSRGFRLTGKGQSEAFAGSELSANMFSLLGVRPMLGRDFSPDEETYGKHHVVLLSFDLWQRRFGGDTGIVGQDVTLNDEHYTVVGVMPPRTFFPEANAQLWTPLAFDPDEARNRQSHNYMVYGRLKPHVTLAEGQAEMQSIAGRLAQSNPESKGWGAEVCSLHEALVGDSRRGLLLLLASVGLVLLIGVFNVVNLLLAKSVARTREFAVRTALGAGRARLAGQLLTEGLLLALLGGVAGSLVAYLGVDILVQVSPPDLPRLAEGISLDSWSLGFALLLSLGAGVVFGLVPTLRLSAATPAADLSAGSRGSGVGRRGERFRRGLVVSEVALALMLLVSASLVIRSFSRLLSQELGYDPAQVVTVDIGLTDRTYPDQPARARFFAQLLAKVRALPGLESSALIAGLPLARWDAHVGVEVVGAAPRGPADPGGADYVQASADYFRVLKIPFVRGRDFTDRDTSSSLPVVIVNESFVRTFKLGADALGRHVNVGDGAKQAEIIGVVHDTKRRDLAASPRAEMYRPYQQACWGQMSLVARTRAHPAEVARLVRGVLDSLDKDVPVLSARSLTQLMASSVAQRRLSMQFLSGFAGLGVLLAAVGLYGVLGYHVTQRSKEIGIRMAVGAAKIDVLRLVVGQGVRLAAIGIVIGLAGALALTRVLRAWLYEVSPTDPMSFLATAALILLAATVACWLPGRRAARVDPMVALRSE